VTEGNQNFPLFSVSVPIPWQWPSGSSLDPAGGKQTGEMAEVKTTGDSQRQDGDVVVLKLKFSQRIGNSSLFIVVIYCCTHVSD
jgi:hypothetical protein